MNPINTKNLINMDLKKYIRKPTNKHFGSILGLLTTYIGVSKTQLFVLHLVTSFKAPGIFVYEISPIRI